ncbi:TetR/AcrR family transcriptional regulator [Shewanella submarina]|uniref:TetR/AcrR family transcriptional regulator n=1 Tax=Shewanella submarina TaxID=2016376 RepID=A0ABV7GD63_9GAMM|nr:TetR/AcrR family transcriptional regulator [Shewanella submarina]MCL1036665.1 TetR/AcrR family transcriptional regulator [Shewanella submarina]
MSVKLKKRGRPGADKSQLSAELILNMARQLMRENGKVPSIRQLANELDIDAMAIYHYYANKAALLEALTVSLIEEIYTPSGTGDWQAELKQLCQSYLALLSRQQGLLETMLSMTSYGPAQVFSDKVGIALKPLALTDTQLMQVIALLADYLHGVAIAAQCNPGNDEVTNIDGPYALICLAIEAHRH